LIEKESEIDENFKLISELFKAFFEHSRVIAYNYLLTIWAQSLEKVNLFLIERQQFMFQNPQTNLIQQDLTLQHSNITSSEHSNYVNDTWLNQKESQPNLNYGLNQAHNWLENLTSLKKAVPAQNDIKKVPVNEGFISKQARLSDSTKTNSDLNGAELPSFVTNKNMTTHKNFNQKTHDENTQSSLSPGSTNYEGLLPSLKESCENSSKPSQKSLFTSFYNVNLQKPKNRQ